MHEFGNFESGDKILKANISEWYLNYFALRRKVIVVWVAFNKQ